jgi:hypothetical protein
MTNQPTPDPLPGNGFFGWLGRQIAHVRKALRTDISASKTVYQNRTVEEKPLPQDPKVKLRRTVIDEVVVDNAPPKSSDKKSA